jgi:hypothetical protein
MQVKGKCGVAVGRIHEGSGQKQARGGFFIVRRHGSLFWTNVGHCLG